MKKLFIIFVLISAISIMAQEKPVKPDSKNSVSVPDSTYLKKLLRDRDDVAKAANNLFSQIETAQKQYSEMVGQVKLLDIYIRDEQIKLKPEMNIREDKGKKEEPKK